jgi:hypothetical protein
MNEQYTPADTLQAGDMVVDARGYRCLVMAVNLVGRSVLVTVRPEVSTAAWPAGEERTVRVSRRRMVLVVAF